MVLRAGNVKCVNVECVNVECVNVKPLAAVRCADRA